MKKRLLGMIACLAIVGANAAELNWHTSLPEAQAKAKAEKKLVMMDFTGSDWCGWCIRLDKEVFSKPEFEEYAEKNLVLVEVDFPHKTEQSSELKAANKALAQEYGIRGYPTIIVLSSDGERVGKLGYVKGGPKAFIAKIDELNDE